MIPFAKRLCLALAIAAVACAQVFGLQSGYVCSHGDGIVITAAEHCHEHAHGEHLDHAPCQNAGVDDCEDHEEKHHHQPVKVDLQVAPSSLAPLHVPAFIAILIPAEFCPTERLFEFPARQESLSQLEGSEAEGPPSLAVQVVTCQVLLV